MPGIGTVINVLAILLGSAAGVFAGHRLPERSRETVTDALGLITLVVGAFSVLALTDSGFEQLVGSSWTLLVVLGGLVIGGIAGSLLRIEDRLEDFGGILQARLVGGGGSEARERFVSGFVTASLVFCIGPLAVLGSMNDGLGNGIDQLLVKSALDLFASVAFAASLGWGVALAALPVALLQGTVTVVALLAGGFLPDALISSITATGGVLLLGIGLRLLGIKQIPVGDLLPALVVAPLLAATVGLVVN